MRGSRLTDNMSTELLNNGNSAQFGTVKMPSKNKRTGEASAFHINILGGGIAGLSAGYFAQKKGLHFTVYESKHIVGGNCLTLKYKDFFYDSGAHRFHDKYASMTQELKNLLGDELREIQVPSQIYNSGTYIDFPLTPLDLISKLGVPTLLKGTIDLIKARMARRSPREDFEGFAVHTYGKTIAELFLLGYTRKLWGIPPSRLSPVTSGGRLKGLTISTFLHETFGGNKKKTRHLDGSFYYPTQGIHVIPARLAESCGNGRIHTDSRITRIFHDYDKIRAIEVNGRDRIDTGPGRQHSPARPVPGPAGASTTPGDYRPGQVPPV